MEPNILSNLRQLPALGKGNYIASKCKICGEDAFQFDVVDFNKVCDVDFYRYGLANIPVPYWRCKECGFVFTNFFDDWTTQDFAAFIYNSEYLLVDGEYKIIRPTMNAEAMSILLADHRAARILDYGSGTGAFAERLSASGFRRVENYDPFTSPRRPEGRFDIITCFETMEHAPFPTDTIADMFSFMEPAGCMVVGTGIQPANISELRANWWYIAPRNGHISIYTHAALESLGAHVGLEFYSGEGRIAFAGRTPSAQSMALLRSIGPLLISVRLTAPADPNFADKREQAAIAQSECWNSIEKYGPMRFRWTRTSRIEWKLNKQPSNYPCKLTVAIPFLMEILPGFAEQCRVEIDSFQYPLHREGSSLIANIDLHRPLRQSIALITPNPQRPSDLRGAPDQRTLGLAIPTA